MKINENILQLIDTLGHDKAHKILKDHVENSSKDLLTIVTNEGPHKIPDHLIRGELFIASKGDFDFSSERLINEQYSKCLKSLSEKLMEKSWHQIYLIPFGPTTFNMLVKLLVFRVTYSDSIDYVYRGSGEYLKLDFNSRELINEKQNV